MKQNNRMILRLKLIRIDEADGDECDFCERIIRSNLAWEIDNKNRSMVFCDSCVEELNIHE